MNTITDPKHNKTRKVLRIIGISFLIIGGILAAIGLIDFFSAFNNMEQPKYFFLLFIAFPLLGIGGICTALGFMKAATSFVASQTAPVTTDVFNYVVDKTSDTLANTAGKVADKIKGKEAKETVNRCPSCGAPNDSDAVFCKSCGKPLKRTCPKCGNVVDGDARFCDNCGEKLN